MQYTTDVKVSGGNLLDFMIRPGSRFTKRAYRYPYVTTMATGSMGIMLPWLLLSRNVTCK